MWRIAPIANLTMNNFTRLTAYVPMERLQALANGRFLPYRTSGAALLADISGFTPMVGTLTQELGRKAGAEAALRAINPVYAALIRQLHHYRGSVIGFAGDSITCWFDGLDTAVLRAATCAQAMQAAMQPFTTLYTPAGTPINLQIKLAISAGAACRFLVGNPDILLIDGLAGETLARMAQAERLADRGELVVSQEVADALGDMAQIGAWRTGEGGNGRFTVIAQLAQPAAADPWPPLPDTMADDPAVLAQLYASAPAHFHHDLSAVGDLRPVTPMFIRFTGFDFDQDDCAGEKLNQYVTWVQETIHQYGGSLLQMTIGDKGAYLYAVFGAPVAHDDDIRRALTAACKLQQTPPHLPISAQQMQIGLSRGDAWSGNCGSDERHSYAVMGSEVNLAARLMSRCPPGQIYVSGYMSKHTGFNYRFIGDLTYKGYDQPIPTFRLLSEKSVEEKTFQQPLVGREAEMAILETAVSPIFNDRADGRFADRFAGLIVIYGEAGIGKSHLAYALRQRLGDRAQWLSGQSDQLKQQAFHPFISLLRQQFRQNSEENEAARLAQFKRRLADLRRLLRQQAASRASDHLAELDRTAPILAALLDLPCPDSLYANFSAEEKYRNAILAIKNFLLALSCLRPTVVELEDGHWFDNASRELLPVLTRQVADYPLCLLITSRYSSQRSPENAYPTAPNTPVTAVHLQPLADLALQALVEDMLNGAVHPDLQQLLAAKTQANPFFAQQYLYYLQENERLALDPAGRWTVASGDWDLPTSVNAVLTARIDRLAPAVKEAVQTAAVLGAEFDVNILRQMLAHPDVSVWVELAEKGRIWSLKDELRCLFKHNLMRQVAYEMQLTPVRRHKHQLAADAYETLFANHLPPYYGDLAYHYGQARDADKERQYAELAGRKASADGFQLDAIAHLQRALTLTPAEQIESRYGLLQALEQAYHWQGARAEQAAVLAELSQLAEMLGAAQVTAVRLRQADYAFQISDYANCIEAATAVIAQQPPPAIAAEARLLWGQALLRQGERQPALAQLELGQRLAQTAAAERTLSNCLRVTGIIFYEQGDYERAWDYYEEALTIARQCHYLWSEAASLNNQGILAYTQHDYERAETRLTRALALRRQLGDRVGEAIALNNFSIMHSLKGDFAESLRCAEQCLTLRREVGDRLGELIALRNIMPLRLWRGQKEKAIAVGREAIAIAQEIGYPYGLAPIQLHLLCVAVEEGALSAAYENGAALIGEIRALQSHQHLAYGLVHWGEILLALGRVADAEAAFQEAYDLRLKAQEQLYTLEPLSGLARTALANGQAAKGREYVERLLTDWSVEWLLTTQADGLNIVLACLEVVTAVADPRASAIRQQICRWLETAPLALPAEERHDFLHNDPARRQALALCAGVG